MFKNKILQDLQKAVKDLGYPSTDIVLSSPKNPAFGDYSTNLALQLAKLKLAKHKQSPPEIANEIMTRVKSLESSEEYLEKVEIAGGGFINFFIKDKELVKNLGKAKNLETLSPKKILVEYGHTNPLKEVHIGHLRTFILGESVVRILTSVGNEVFRANYQGDIGLHIAKAVWGMEKLGLPSKSLSLEEKADYMGRSYAEGNKAYEEDQISKKEIERVNSALYRKDAKVLKIYQLARKWSLQYFEPIYELLNIKYDRCFFESEVYELGSQIVLANTGKIFVESQGAIIFPGEKYGLHNRVFITTSGHSTYEGKEIGLAKLEYDSFKYDQAVHVVAHEQAGYFQVVFKAIEMVFPNLADKKYHLSYGLVDLKEGKMSSREGNIITVDDLYRIVSEKVREVMKESRGSVDQEIVREVAVGAIKFAYLKFSPAPNMIFDLEQSVCLEGDSGPYVQYTYARIQSVLRNAKKERGQSEDLPLEKYERSILRHLLYFSDVVTETAILLHPNLLASYLIELSKLYNLFYQECRIIDSAKADFRLKLSKDVAEVLKKGLDLLGIEAPERM